MHVLVIPSQPFAPPESPLSGIFQKDQVLALRDSGLKVGVVSIDLVSNRVLRGKKRGARGYFQMEKQEGILCHRFRSWNWFSVFGDLATLPWIQIGLQLFKRYMRSAGRPDLIHAHNGVLAGQLAQSIKKRFNIPYVITEHSSYFARRMIRTRTMVRIGKAYEDCSLLIAVSKGLGETLEALYGGKARPWVTIPNMLGKGFIENCLSPGALKNPKRTFRFLNIGNLQDVKGQADLIQAFQKYFPDDKSVELRIGGDGLLRENLERMIIEMGLTDRVRLLGYQERSEVLREMATCDTFVLSSHYETFGVVLIEALSCGKPVITTACGGPDSIVDDTNGILVPLGEVDLLGKAMVAMRSMAGKYHGKKIRENCVATFGEKAVARQLIDAYERVIL